MKDQRGITLIELLVTITLLGIVVIPILTLMTGTFTNTVSQGKESQLQYFAQEVIEEARVNSFPGNLGGKTIYGVCTPESGCSEIDTNKLSMPTLTSSEILYEIHFQVLTSATNESSRNELLEKNFYEIEVVVKSSEPNSHEVMLVTVVKKQT
ncbi:type IV pilus modification PilV family protein [Alkalihalobacterium chitinilyticum]|uniref:Type II secretion system GspH family protein n=1 Tax=Alkalihalobacterium chitinilyticum TaxID=2980103 RepID=A0ABT5VAF6_9BACI|nr:type II secretion system protein [Alkalihalobacterium chitinilyticum]MDE5412433.1 type II secretion system GspH family protein [Alkalihalobacterium chitinilyticum]